MTAVRQMVDEIGATWVGTACVVDQLREPQLRRALNVRTLLHVRDL